MDIGDEEEKEKERRRKDPAKFVEARDEDQGRDPLYWASFNVS